MYPLTFNPTVNILTNEKGEVLRIATNIDPEIVITTTQSVEAFEDQALNKPFVTYPQEN